MAVSAAFAGTVGRPRDTARAAVHHCGGTGVQAKREAAVLQPRPRQNPHNEQKSVPNGHGLSLLICGGDEGDRTPYLLNAIQALSQVSYTPTGLLPFGNRV